jgi:hypothetical protein
VDADIFGSWKQKKMSGKNEGTMGARLVIHRLPSRRPLHNLDSRVSLPASSIAKVVLAAILERGILGRGIKS